jgi:PAS domain S-box-containing protein
MMPTSAQDPQPRPPHWVRWMPVAYLVVGLAWIFGSDHVLDWLFRDDPGALLFAGLLKGVLFVVVTAVLMHLALLARWEPVSAAAGETERLHARLWQPVTMFLIAGLMIAAAGYGLYARQAGEVREEAAAKLQAISDLNSLQVAAWFADRRRPMREAADSPFTGRAVADWLADGDAELEALLIQRLEAIRSANDFAAVRVFDVRGRELLGVGEEIAGDALLRATITRAHATGDVEDSNMHRLPRSDGPVMVIDFAVALRGGAGDATLPGAVIVARVRPGSFLERVTAAGTGGFQSGETLLVRRDGDHMLYLGRLRFGEPLTFATELPMSRDELASVRLLKGDRGPLEALDYRGVPVLAAGRPVAGTDWMLVTKVDAAEIRAPLLRFFLMAAGLVVAAIVVAGVLVALWWRGERLRAHLRLAIVEARADALAQRFGWVNRHAHDVILLLDESGRILDVNESAERLYGYSRDQLLGMTVFDLRDPDPAERERAQRQIATVRGSGALLFEARHRRQDGSTFPVEVSSGRVEVDGQHYVQSVVRDISERKAQEARIAELATERDRTLAQLQLQFERMPIGCVVTGPGLIGLQVNPAFERMFGYTQSEFEGPNPSDLIIPPELRAELADRLAPLATGDETITLVHENLTKSGKRITCRWSNTPLRGPDGAFLGVLAMCEDITEQLAAERALRDSEERFRVLADVSPVGIFRTDAAGQCTYVNSRWCEIAGMSATDALGDGWARALHPDDVSTVVAHWRAAVAGEPFRAEYRFGRSGDRWNWVLGQALPEYGQQDSVTGYVGTVTDITDLKQAQAGIEEARGLLEQRVAERTQELVAAKERAERADSVKSSFLSMMSHELRTPLNSILGFTDVILQRFSGPLTPEQERQLGIVRDSSMHLLALINDVLDISRIEAGQLRLEIGPVDLPDLLRRRMQAFEAQAAAKGLALECRIDDGVGVIRSDARRIAQIVTNLLSNAVKFTEQGRVALDARANGLGVEIEVSDSGHGIAADELPLLFTAFEQLATTRRGNKDGTGLGLAISRHLARALGGDIAVASTPGQGSRFTLRLPLAAPSSDDFSESGIFSQPRQPPAPLS